MMHLYIDMRRHVLCRTVFGAWLGVGYAGKTWEWHDAAFADHEA